MNKIELAFKARATVDMGTWFILSKKDAIEFISACKKENIGILGVDGFFLFGKKIQPSMDNSIDYSSKNIQKLEDIYSAAIKFIKTRGEKLFFEIVCSD